MAHAGKEVGLGGAGGLGGAQGAGQFVLFALFVAQGRRDVRTVVQNDAVFLIQPGKMLFFDGNSTARLHHAHNEFVFFLRGQHGGEVRQLHVADAHVHVGGVGEIMAAGGHRAFKIAAFRGGNGGFRISIGEHDVAVAACVYTHNEIIAALHQIGHDGLHGFLVLNVLRAHKGGDVPAGGVRTHGYGDLRPACILPRRCAAQFHLQFAFARGVAQQQFFAVEIFAAQALAFFPRHAGLHIREKFIRRAAKVAGGVRRVHMLGSHQIARQVQHQRVQGRARTHFQHGGGFVEFLLRQLLFRHVNGGADGFDVPAPRVKHGNVKQAFPVIVFRAARAHAHITADAGNAGRRRRVKNAAVFRAFLCHQTTGNERFRHVFQHTFRPVDVAGFIILGQPSGGGVIFPHAHAGVGKRGGKAVLRFGQGGHGFFQRVPLFRQPLLGRVFAADVLNIGDDGVPAAPVDAVHLAVQPFIEQRLEYLAFKGGILLAQGLHDARLARCGLVQQQRVAGLPHTGAGLFAGNGEHTLVGIQQFKGVRIAHENAGVRFVQNGLVQFRLAGNIVKHGVHDGAAVFFTNFAALQMHPLQPAGHLLLAEGNVHKRVVLHGILNFLQQPFFVARIDHVGGVPLDQLAVFFHRVAGKRRDAVRKIQSFHALRCEFVNSHAAGNAVDNIGQLLVGFFQTVQRVFFVRNVQYEAGYPLAALRWRREAAHILQPDGAAALAQGAVFHRIALLVFQLFLHGADQHFPFLWVNTL